MLNNYKSPLGYVADGKKIDTYGVDHSGFTTKDEIEYQMARQKRENSLIEGYNNQGITKDYPQYGTNFWGKADNNYGFGSSNIADNIKNKQTQDISSALYPNPIGNNAASYKLAQNINTNNGIESNVKQIYNMFQNLNPSSIGENASKYINSYIKDINFRNNERHNLIRAIEEPTSFVFSLITSNTPEDIPNYQQSKNIQSLNGNQLDTKERIDAYKTNKDIYINLEDKEEDGFKTFPYHDEKIGKYYVEKYSPIIEKYAKENGIDSNIVKAILFSEASDYHDEGANRLGDVVGKIPFSDYILKIFNRQSSTSIWPMNIQSKTWGDFQGKRYDVYNPEQNIALSVKLLKEILDSVPDKDIAKIATLWNNTGAKQVSDYGARTKYYYDNSMWDKRKLCLDNKKL